ncbi:MAG TPA: bifunctional adenosylcobinamide kinase/adenosylcobinamide-phosphate guanylyltransferase, partial [Petrotogaceae bacterium]|nr:bifunctional adenosylcobinamide kinase/adenosylcobinamide-phosphate guanylyltransferase [Petrotogaceae bacterium]
YDVILVECITTWLSNLLYYEKDIEKYTESFMNNLTGKEVIITNEVGLGIVPIDPLSRRYTDAIGKLNSKLARKADEVYLMVSSIPVKIK